MAKQKVKILLAGGGSGGHILPVVAVAERLTAQMPKSELRFWCDYKMLSRSKELFADQPVKVSGLASGKFRRYHHLTWWQNLQPGILLPNLIDLFKVVAGLLQALGRMLVWRPDVVFAKGGFVCLPIGLAAWLLRIKLVIHDSDTVPGLTNRILAKFASKIATGYPVEYYNYPKNRTVFTGIPVRSSLAEAETIDQVKLRQDLKLPTDQSIVLVTGGGLGSRHLNQSITRGYSRIKAFTILVTGEEEYQLAVDGLEGEYQNRLQVINFANNLDQLILASDVVVSRAGATIIAELALAGKPTILVPNPMLTGGHQLKNAQILGEAKAVMVVDDQAVSQDHKALIKAINQLLTNRGQAKRMAVEFKKFARPDAVAHLADLILCQIDVAKIERVWRSRYD